MSLTIEKERDISFAFEYETLAEQVVEFAIEHEGFPYDAEVNLTLTDDEGIREYNRTYRGIDAPTDVLSFPLISYEKAGEFSDLEQDFQDNFNPDTGEIMLGDIVISAERLKAQAISYGHSEKREFAFLIVHSMLHLFGYDHMTEEEAAVMEAKQDEILNTLRIFRSEEKILK